MAASSNNSHERAQPPDMQVALQDAAGQLSFVANLLDATKYADAMLLAVAPPAEGSAEQGAQHSFRCHRAILAARSPYFDAIFSSGALAMLRCVFSPADSLPAALYGLTCAFIWHEAEQALPFCCPGMREAADSKVVLEDCHPVRSPDDASPANTAGPSAARTGKHSMALCVQGPPHSASGC